MLHYLYHTTAICSTACPNIQLADTTLQPDGDEGENGLKKEGEKGKKNGKKGDVYHGKKQQDGADSDKGQDNVVMMLVERGVRHPASLSSSLSLLLEVSIAVQ